MSLTYLPVEDRDPFVLSSQYHGCYSPGGIKLVILEYFRTGSITIAYLTINTLHKHLAGIIMLFLLCTYASFTLNAFLVGKWRWS